MAKSRKAAMMNGLWTSDAGLSLRFLAMPQRSALGIVFLLCAVFAARGFVSARVRETAGPVNGVVVTKDAQPIAGVSVYGSIWKQCCPAQRDSSKTNEKGEFILHHGGAVVHFWKDGLQPLAIVIKPGTSELRVIMHAERDAMNVAACTRPGPGQKEIGWGRLHFIVPKKGLTILGGKPDTDYMKYIIRPKKGESFLALWFGPYAMSTEPDDDQFIRSVLFSQRDLVDAKGEALGMDSRGQKSNGQRWRQTGMLGSGAAYRDADQASAAIFDKIIDSACTVEFPRK